MTGHHLEPASRRGGRRWLIGLALVIGVSVGVGSTRAVSRTALMHAATARVTGVLHPYVDEPLAPPLSRAVTYDQELLPVSKAPPRALLPPPVEALPAKAAKKKHSGGVRDRGSSLVRGALGPSPRPGATAWSSDPLYKALGL